MGSKVARYFKGLAVVVCVVGAISGVVAMDRVGDLPGVGAGTGVTLMLAVWGYSFFVGVALFACGEILENLAEIRSNTAQQLEIGARQAEALTRLLAIEAPSEAPSKLAAGGLGLTPATSVSPLRGSVEDSGGKSTAARQLRQEALAEAIRRDPSLADVSDAGGFRRLEASVATLQDEYRLTQELEQLRSAQEALAAKNERAIDAQSLRTDLLNDPAIARQARGLRRIYGPSVCVDFLNRRAAELGLDGPELTEEDIPETF